MGGVHHIFSKALVPQSFDGSELIGIACRWLKTQINSADPLSGGQNRRRLENPYARGYVFGYVHAFLRKGRITDEPLITALITLAHTTLFGTEAGISYMREALADHTLDSEIMKGRATGAADIVRWFSDCTLPPCLLCDYLSGRNVPAGVE